MTWPLFYWSLAAYRLVEELSVERPGRWTWVSSNPTNFAPKSCASWLFFSQLENVIFDFKTFALWSRISYYLSDFSVSAVEILRFFQYTLFKTNIWALKTHKLYSPLFNISTRNLISYCESFIVYPYGLKIYSEL